MPQQDFVDRIRFIVPLLVSIVSSDVTDCDHVPLEVLDDIISFFYLCCCLSTSSAFT